MFMEIISHVLTVRFVNPSAFFYSVAHHSTPKFRTEQLLQSACQIFRPEGMSNSLRVPTNKQDKKKFKFKNRARAEPSVR